MSTGIVSGRVILGAYDFDQFWDWFFTDLMPLLPDDAVVIMDNARIHHNPDMIELAELHGIRVRFLPSYSPDLNPLELIFNTLKSYLKKIGPTILSLPEGIIDVEQLLAEALAFVTPEVSNACFAHSNYL